LTATLPPLHLLRELQSIGRVNALSLGKKEYAPLKIFLKKDALNFHLDNVVKTYVLIDKESSRVWGYISLMCSEVNLDGVDRSAKNKHFKRYKTYPAVKLARLAVDTLLQGKGYGQKLVSYAIEIAKDCIMPNIGCRFFIVDSKPGAVSFYEKAGFAMLASEGNKEKAEPLMLLDLHKLTS
jgi:GNAT superfamily N-acetyltransferase